MPELFLSILAIFLSTIGNGLIIIEEAVISSSERIQGHLFRGMEGFREKPYHFVFAVKFLTILSFSLAFVLSGVVLIKNLMLGFITLLIIISLLIVSEFVKPNPAVVKIFLPLVFFLHLFFKIFSFIPTSLVEWLISSESESVRKRFEFLLKKIQHKENPELSLLKNVIEFRDTTVREIMIPRTKVVAIDINSPREKIIKTVIDEGYSRLPVYKDTIDNIIGIVYTKDLINFIDEPHLFVLHDLIRPAYFVPETKKISELLRELQRNKIHMAIVVDEFGGFEGIVTLEDILEEIVGEIHDEYDEIRREYEILSDGSIVVDAGMSVSDLNREFNLNLPGGVDYESIGGFVSKIFGRIPDEGEKVKYEQIVFEVLRKTKRRIVQIKITKGNIQ